jgi:hypothetical protein
MAGLQPFNTGEKLYYPSGQQPLLPGIYDVNSLTETGDNLYTFNVGDYAYTSLVPVPHVELTIFALNPNTVTVTVSRTAGGRTMPVRGQIGVYAVGGRNVVDWEAPFGIPLSYRAEQFDVNGQSLGSTVPFEVQLDVTETWIHNVFQPAQGIAITPANGWAETLSRPVPTEKYWASGGGLATGIFGQRHGLTDTPLPFLTFTEDDADSIRDMFGDPYTSPSATPVVCIRTAAGKNMRLPKPFYVALDDALEVPLDTPSGGALTRWECTGTEVNPPAPALVASVLTYDDIDFSYATYGAMDAAYSSYLARDRDYSLAGAADGA